MLWMTLPLRVLCSPSSGNGYSLARCMVQVLQPALKDVLIGRGAFRDGSMLGTIQSVND